MFLVFEIWRGFCKVLVFQIWRGSKVLVFVIQRGSLFLVFEIWRGVCKVLVFEIWRWSKVFVIQVFVIQRGSLFLVFENCRGLRSQYNSVRVCLPTPTSFSPCKVRLAFCIFLKVADCHTGCLA